MAVRYVTNNYRFLLFRKNPKCPGFKLFAGSAGRGGNKSNDIHILVFLQTQKNILGINSCRDWSTECDKSNDIVILVVLQKSKISRV